MQEMLYKSRHSEEEFQQAWKLGLLSYEHWGNQDVTPEAESADIVFFYFFCCWLEKFTKNIAKSFLL
jgi:hypothetical protein